MTRSLAVFTTGILVGIVITIAAIFLVIPDKMFVEQESPLGFEETMNALEESAEANQWTISHRYNLQAAMEKNGFEVEPVMVMSLCKPVYANNILSNNSSRLISAIMPCRLAVYEKQGRTYTSVLNSRIMYPFLNKEDRRTLRATTDETMNIINFIP
jgi:uncharacterized protein (DUF302 family)